MISLVCGLTHNLGILGVVVFPDAMLMGWASSKIFLTHWFSIAIVPTGVIGPPVGLMQGTRWNILFMFTSNWYYNARASGRFVFSYGVNYVLGYGSVAQTRTN